MASTENGEDRFGVRLPRHAARVLEALRRRGIPAGARPKSRAHIVECALLAYAAAEGVVVGEE
jgi:hypothetical protein